MQVYVASAKCPYLVRLEPLWNRTIVDFSQVELENLTFNRTNVELKPVQNCYRENRSRTFNRTIVELKHLFRTAQR